MPSPLARPPWRCSIPALRGASTCVSKFQSGMESLPHPISMRLCGSMDKTLEKGLPQTASYMDRCGADPGDLVIFYRSAKPWQEKAHQRSEECGGTQVEVWGM